MKEATHPPPADSDFVQPRYGVVSQLFPDRGYGFITSAHGAEVRFGRDVVLRDEFDELRVGSEVRYEETDTPNGLDATAVDLLSTPMPDAEESEELLGDEDEIPEMPPPFEEDQ